MKLSRRSLIFLVACCILQGGVVREALAKKVVIEWKPIELAVKYELHVEHEEKIVFKKSMEETRWKGELPPGAYTYQVRGIDRMSRPGQWSDWKSLAVMPAPPQTQFPVDGSRVDLYHPNVPISLRWESTVGVKSYAIEVLREGQVFSKLTVAGTQTVLKNIPAGKYSWQVRPILQLGANAPAGLRGKSWESPKAEKGVFEVRLRTLEAPLPRSPLGSLAPAEDRVVRLRWDEVEGAEGYLVRIAKSSPPKNGVVSADAAGDLKKVKQYYTRETQWAVRVGSEGGYVWGVRALAHLDENKKPGAQSLEGVGRFSLDRNAVFTSDLGYIALSTMLAPYTYQLSSPLNNVQGSTSASALVFRLSGEYWVKPLWAIGLAAELATFQMSGQSFSRPTFEVTTKFRTQLSSGVFGWSFSPKVGAELRTYNYILPNNLSALNSSATGLTGHDISILGAAVGFDLRKQLSEGLSLGIKASYFYPVSLMSSGGVADKISGDVSYRNFNIGVQGLYWVSRSVGIGVGGYFENRSIGFTSTGGGAEAEKVYMDGMYFFGSMIYRIWR